tara:strand:- start:258 stop:776 length:519 start_codon:yes stop_codon:yes gene_type:complete
MANNQSITVDYGEYRRLLDGLGSLEKSANREMRQEAELIAESIMMPAIKSAISSHAPNYASKLNATIRTKQDRLPGVRVGNSTKTSSRGTILNSRTAGGSGVFSGGATSNMIRFGTIKGYYTSRSGRPQLWAQGIRPGWTDTADEAYSERAFAAWEKTAEELIDRWNRGVDH